LPEDEVLISPPALIRKSENPQFNNVSAAASTATPLAIELKSISKLSTDVLTAFSFCKMANLSDPIFSIAAFISFSNGTILLLFFPKPHNSTNGEIVTSYFPPVFFDIFFAMVKH